MKICTHCGQEINSSATTCPNCGTRQSNDGTTGRRRYLRLAGACILGAGAVVVLLFFMMVATDPGDNLTLDEAGIRNALPGRGFVTGTLRNRTDRSYAHVQVVVDLLDEAGRVAGTTSASTNDLGAGETWTFEAPVPAEATNNFRQGRLDCTLRAATRAKPLVAFACREGGA